ncbi:MAG TPA: methyltransferase [Steroidobacteraceae bacterium]|nr:methyltransferase [Steroidobacteraceae bacterium]
MSSTDPRQAALQLATGYWSSRCLHVVAELGVADHIGAEPQSVEALAKAVGAHPQALARVLRALAALGLFEEAGGGYRHTEASRMLRSDHPQSLRAFVRMMGMPVHWQAYGELEHSVRTGESAMTRIAPGGTFQYFADHPAQARIFDDAMAAKSHEQIANVIGAYDFPRTARIADIGGGRGHLLRAVLAANPGTTGVLFDLPHVIVALASSPLADRLTLRSGSFFTDALPECDVYLLMSVIHDWGDSEAMAILNAVRRAAPAHARVLLLEMLLPEAPGPHPAKFLDIEMLVMTSGGRERTRSEYEQLLEAAGMHLARVIPTQTPTMVLEAVLS